MSDATKYDLVKQAADAIREEWSGDDLGKAQAFNLAVADWLWGVWFNEPVVDEEMNRAYRVACAYLGETA